MTAVTSPPTAFAVSGIGVVVLVLLGAVFRVIPDTAAKHGPRPPAGRTST